jgi:hypothetical protein
VIRAARSRIGSPIRLDPGMLDASEFEVPKE